MTPVEVEATLRAALEADGAGDIPVRRGRFESVAEASGPSILLRQAGVEGLGTIDRATLATGFEIECRSPTRDGAGNLASLVVGALADRATLPPSVYGKRDNASAQRGGYFARVVEVEVAS